MDFNLNDMKTIKILVIDDSAYNRRAISKMLRDAPDVEVTGEAVDGEEGLKLLMELKPDVVTLDLEMPRMDGFTFLRMLMSQQPTPVIVVSSYANRSNVFRALELGAVDFIAKPGHFLTEERESIQDELLEKIRAVRGSRPGIRSFRSGKRSDEAVCEGPMRVIAIGASTGGPPALQQILTSLPMNLNASVVVAQHMPARFTSAFAERMNRKTNFNVCHAEDNDELERGTMLLAPGGKHMEVIRSGGRLRVKIFEPADDLYVPSVDILFNSVAEAAGNNCLGIVLTGMGRDGSSGILSIKESGGATIAESESTAVIFGMPAEAIKTGGIDGIYPLHEIPKAIVDYVCKGRVDKGR